MWQLLHAPYAGCRSLFTFCPHVTVSIVSNSIATGERLDCELDGLPTGCGGSSTPVDRCGVGNNLSYEWPDSSWDTYRIRRTSIERRTFIHIRSQSSDWRIVGRTIFVGLDDWQMCRTGGKPSSPAPRYFAPRSSSCVAPDRNVIRVRIHTRCCHGDRTCACTRSLAKLSRLAIDAFVDIRFRSSVKTWVGLRNADVLFQPHNVYAFMNLW
jgi:hypothetical protein